jgi:hypothetical protein
MEQTAENNAGLLASVPPSFVMHFGAHSVPLVDLYKHSLTCVCPLFL